MTSSPPTTANSDGCYSGGTGRAIEGEPTPSAVSFSGQLFLLHGERFRGIQFPEKNLRESAKGAKARKKTAPGRITRAARCFSSSVLFLSRFRLFRAFAQNAGKLNAQGTLWRG